MFSTRLSAFIALCRPLPSAHRDAFGVSEYSLVSLGPSDAAIALKREMPSIPLVMLTMYGDLLDRTSAKAVTAVISKADGITALTECVQKILAESN